MSGDPDKAIKEWLAALTLAAAIFLGGYFSGTMWLMVLGGLGFIGTLLKPLVYLMGCLVGLAFIGALLVGWAYISKLAH